VVGGREYWVGASTGIAVFPRDGGDPDSLIRNAYTAMREAKASGGDGHRFFSSAMNAGNDKRQALETRLRHALEQGELELHYQPKVEIETGRITGAEGLLRWTDSELGVVEPADVIPMAEETGLIAEIGSWSLRTACADCAAWQALGFGGLRVSVNLSPRQVVDDSIREQVVRALWDTGLAPSQLELEITEGTLMENEEVAIRLLEDLKEVGVVISLDDFGTGFSSLSYLKRFPVDVLKIDQSFVQDIAVDPDDAAIVGAIISIADNLQLGVIAEGVETEQQRAFLRGRGCPEMQGFLFAPAVPSAQLVEMLRKQRERPIE
jgi:EAL domain-containing protein (putative c-di-GMP-specific phosphodiesterase class I)